MTTQTTDLAPPLAEAAEFQALKPYWGFQAAFDNAELGPRVALAFFLAGKGAR